MLLILNDIDASCIRGLLDRLLLLGEDGLVRLIGFSRVDAANSYPRRMALCYAGFLQGWRFSL